MFAHLQPIGPIKRAHSSEDSEDDSPTKRSAAKKHRESLLTPRTRLRSRLDQESREKYPSVAMFFRTREKIEDAIKIEANDDDDNDDDKKTVVSQLLPLESIITRSSSVGHEPVGQGNDSRFSGLKRTASLSKNETSPNSAAKRTQTLTSQEANKLNWKDLGEASDTVARRQAANDFHDYEGVRILKTSTAPNGLKEPGILPYEFYTMFDAYTNKGDNADFPEKVQGDHWIYCLEQLSYVNTECHMPMAIQLHSIAYDGLKSNNLVKVRLACQKYLNDILHGHHPPRSLALRRKYFHLFFKEMPDFQSEECDLSFAWENFSHLIEEYLDLPNSDGTNRLLNFLINVLEVDVQYWLDECLTVVEKKSSRSEPIISWLLWNQGGSGNVDHHVKRIVKFYVQALEDKDKSKVDPLRRLLSVMAQVINILDRKRYTNDRSQDLASYLFGEMKGLMNKFSDKDLWMELYLLHPDWLSMEVSKQMTLKIHWLPNGSGGIREIANALSVLSVNDEEEDKPEDDMDTTPINNNIVSPSPSTSSKKIRQNHHGETALHMACRKGDVTKAEKVLQQFGPDIIGLADHNGWTALHEACSHGQASCVDLLLSQGLVAIEALQAKGGDEEITPLHDAVFKGHDEIVRKIVHCLYEAGKLKEALSCLTADGLTVHQLSSNNNKIKDILREYQNKQGKSCSDLRPLVLAHPSRFAITAHSFVHQYCATFRLHAIKAVMKGYATNNAQTHPLIALNYCYPYRVIPSNGVLSSFPLDRHRVKSAEDISTFWKVVSKVDYWSSVIHAICMEKKK